MENRELKLSSTLNLRHATDAVSSEPYLIERILDGYKTMAAQVRAGLQLHDIRVSAVPTAERPDLFGESTPQDALFYSVLWETSGSTAAYLLWAQEEGGGTVDFLEEICEGWKVRIHGPCPFDQLEVMYDELMGMMGEMVAEWRSNRAQIGE